MNFKQYLDSLKEGCGDKTKKMSEEEDEIKCPECGAMNPDEAEKCSECGADLTKSDDKEELEEGFNKDKADELLKDIELLYSKFSKYKSEIGNVAIPAQSELTKIKVMLMDLK